MLWLTKFYKLPSFSPVVRYHGDLQNNLFSNILLCIIIGDLPKWNTLKRNTKIILFLKASQIIFFHSFWRSNLWFWKLSTNGVKCSHKQFGGKVSVAMAACETPVRACGCEIYLWEGSDIKWHFASVNLYKSVPPTSCYSWNSPYKLVWPTSKTQFKWLGSALAPSESVCIISKFF